MTADRTDIAEHVHTPDRTRTIAEAAARMAGLDPAGAVLIRHQTNGVYRLVTAPVVIKVAPPGEQNLAEVVNLVSWLHDHAVPTVALWDGVSQPLEIAGSGVTLWRYLPQVRPVKAADIAEPLLALHDAPLPPFSLPPVDPFGEIRHSIASSQFLTDDDRAMLTEHCSLLAQDESRLDFGSTPGLIHGDAHHHNTLLDSVRGGAVLSDLDTAAVAPREWDLVTVEVHCRRFDHPPAEYAEFCQRYGRDVREWSGYAWLRDVRELRMITTNARKSAPGSPAAAEVRRRLDHLRRGEQSIWHIL